MHHSYTLICISEQLKDCTKKIALLLNRKYIFKENIALNEIDIDTEYITIIGLINDIGVDIVSQLMDKNVVFSVVAVKKESDLLFYYSKLNDHNEIELNDIYIEDFLNNYPYISEKKLFSSRACFFSGHGDYICFNMANAVLCSRSSSKGEKSQGKIPLCAIRNECYRKNRLKSYEAKIYLLQQMQAEVLFLNTCSGICFNNRKYDWNYDSMSDIFLNHKGLLFISNYMIGAYTHDETAIYFAMLIYYKNFALALCKYNQLVSTFYKKNKTAVMLGDSVINALVVHKNTKTYYEVISTEKTYVIIKFWGELSLNTITFEINKSCLQIVFNLLDSIQIDRNNKCDYRLGILSESESYKIFIFSEKAGLFEREIIFYNKNSFSKWSFNTFNQLKVSSNTLELFLLGENELKEKCNLWKEKVYQNIDIQEIDKGNLEITTFAYNILIKATFFVNQFNRYLLEEFFKEAVHSNTHLILDNEKFLLRKVEKSSRICSTCNNEIVEMHMEAKSGVGYYIQYVCPQCEILCITNDYDKKINMYLERKNQECKICLSKEGSFIIPVVGAMIINTNIRTTWAKLVENDMLVLHLKIDENYLVGMYYLRVVLVENKKITILHKRVYFD